MEQPDTEYRFAIIKTNLKELCTIEYKQACNNVLSKELFKLGNRNYISVFNTDNNSYSIQVFGPVRNINDPRKIYLVEEIFFEQPNVFAEYFERELGKKAPVVIDQNTFTELYKKMIESYYTTEEGISLQGILVSNDPII